MRQDLELLDAVNGYSHVHLKLHFKADLYPFYPPRVSLVRPKLSGVVPGAVIAHPRLRLRNWQPFRPISSVIEHLRTFLERFARVDLASASSSLDWSSSYAPPGNLRSSFISLARSTRANLSRNVRRCSITLEMGRNGCQFRRRSRGCAICLLYTSPSPRD